MRAFYDHPDHIETIGFFYVDIETKTVYQDLIINGNGFLKIDPAMYDPSGINGYYFKKNVERATYTSEFDFLSTELPYQIDIINEYILSTEKGNLYHLKIDYDEDFDGRDYYGWNRFDLGYFYVEDDTIYLLRGIDPFDQNFILDEALKEASIVCQDEPLEDIFDEEEKGWHEWIVADGDRREYHSYSNLVETGFYEAFVWEKGNGLVKYWSGFGASKDAIELQIVK